MRPPVIAESLLGGLVGSAPARNDVLGDLEEEWRSVAELRGLGHANQWYVLEALRSAPHLLWLWLRHASPLSLIALVLAAAALRLALAALGYLGLFGVASAARGLGLPTAITTVASLVALVTPAVALGALVARLDRSTPVATLAVAGMLALLTGVQSDLIINATLVHPSLYWVTANVLAAPLMLAGGAMVLQRRTVRPAR